MDIRIIKGEREDRLEAVRSDGSKLAFDFPKKGPLPHDAVHWLVEQRLGFASGFWGLVAAGLSPDAVGAMAKAGGHASAKRAAAPDPAIVPVVQAERIVEAFEADYWSGGPGDGEGIRAMALAGCDASLAPPPELPVATVQAIAAELRDLGAAWAVLRPGEALDLHWADAA